MCNTHNYKLINIKFKNKTTLSSTQNNGLIYFLKIISIFTELYRATTCKLYLL